MLSKILKGAGAAAAPRPTFVSTGTRSSAGGGAVTLNKPSGLQVGDLMIAMLIHNNSSGVTWTQLTGWTEVLDSATAIPSLAIQWKIATSADVSASTFTFNSSTSGQVHTGFLAAYRGAAFDVVGSATRAASSSVTASGITVSSANSVLIGLFANTSTSVSVSSGPSGMSLVSSQSVAATAAYYSQQVDAGISGSKTITFSAGAASSGVLLSIKPA